MGEPKMKLTAGALPYSDGSGDQITATVERTDEGVMLRIDMIHHIKVGDWYAVRRMVDDLVHSAERITNPRP